MTQLYISGFGDDDNDDEKLVSKFKKIFKTNNETKSVGQVIKSRTMKWKCAKSACEWCQMFIQQCPDTPFLESTPFSPFLKARDE